MGDETKTMTEVDAVTEKKEGKAEETASVEEKAGEIASVEEKAGGDRLCRRKGYGKGREKEE